MCVRNHRIGLIYAARGPAGYVYMPERKSFILPNMFSTLWHCL